MGRQWGGALAATAEKKHVTDMSAPSDYTGYFLQSSSTLDSALFFVLAAFILNVIVVIVAFCYFDPSPYEPPITQRTFRTIRRISSRRSPPHKGCCSNSPSPSTILFV